MGKTMRVFTVFLGLIILFIFSCVGIDVVDPSKGDSGNGLVGTYYDNINFTNKVLSREDSVVSFNWDQGSPNGGVGSNTFSARWEGFVRPQYSERYTFYTHADDGVRLWVNGKQIVNDWSNHPARTRSGTIDLQAGQYYAIKLEYYENSGRALVELHWSSPSRSKQIIPNSRLFTEIPGSGDTRTLYPVADAYVNQSARNTNFGDESQLYIDTSPENMRSLLRFSVPSLGGEIESATLRLFVTNAGNRPRVYRTSSSWSEDSVTWNNMPSSIGSDLANLSGDVPTGWLEIDVTDAITGSGNSSFLLVPSNTNGVDFDSREASNKPELIVTTSGGGDGDGDGDSDGDSDGDADGDADSDGDSLTFPVRAAFYYPWYPQTWSVSGEHVFYHVIRGYYDSGDPEVIDEHIQDMDYARIDVAIASWWGQGRQHEDTRIPLLLSRTEISGSDLKWAFYYEQEGFGDPSVAALRADLDYLMENYVDSPAIARVDGRPVVFVYNADDGSCEVANRWSQANDDDEWYVVLKVFGGYRDCSNQPDSWHQYGPGTAWQRHSGYSFGISPGFWRADMDAPTLGRDIDRWYQNVRDMVASREPWQLITTYNEWGEGTAVEPATEWASDSGHGLYLDALHTNGQ